MLLENFWHKRDICDMLLFLPSFSVKAAWAYCLRTTWVFLTQARHLWYAAGFAFFLCESCVSLLLESYLSISDTSETFVICICFAFFICESCVSLLLESYLSISDTSETFVICCCFAFFLCESCVSLLPESYLSISDTSETICDRRQSRCISNIFHLCQKYSSSSQAVNSRSFHRERRQKGRISQMSRLCQK